MRHRMMLCNRLLEISSGLENNLEHGSKLADNISYVKSKIIPVNLKSKKLSAGHIRIIARLFEKTVSDSGRIEPLSLLRSVFDDTHIVLQKLSLIIDLIEIRIIECDQKKYMKIKRKDNRVTFKVAPSALIDVYIGFTERFMSFLLNENSRSYRTDPVPFRSNREFIESWFDYVETLHNCRTDYVSGRSSAIIESDAVDKWEELNAREKVTNRVFPFTRLIQEYGLSFEEQIVVMYVLKESVESAGATEHELFTLLRNTKYDIFTKPSILLPDGKLLSEGLILPTEDNQLILSRGEFEIAPEIGAQILNNKTESVKAIVESIIKNEDVLTICTPTKKMSRMVLSVDTKEVVHKSIARFDHGCYRRLTEWGLTKRSSASVRTKESTEYGRLVMLLHGPPGTGKTALAHALAGTLRRPLLTTDISRILDKWVGESEKRLTRIFVAYKKIAKRSGKAPVLLLNEADQLISLRTDISGSTDRMYNQMQNILLENLETFTGILIATTNMIQNIDEAFSRRFDVKLRLDMPSVQERRKLWRILMPTGLPIGSNVDIDALAASYTFSGGQIELVIKNAAVAAADRTEPEQFVRQADLIKYAELELAGSFGNSHKKIVGFA